jgi:hypothetical protein
MTIPIILNHAAYDGSDLTWNALGLGEELKKDAAEVRLFRKKKVLRSPRWPSHRDGY